ncbi:hypothetical protein MAHJHV57_53750 [Mycobacterium avium subsp. hominissuis]
MVQVADQHSAGLYRPWVADVVPHQPELAAAFENERYRNTQYATYR